MVGSYSVGSDPLCTCRLETNRFLVKSLFRNGMPVNLLRRNCVGFFGGHVALLSLFLVSDLFIHLTCHTLIINRF